MHCLIEKLQKKHMKRKVSRFSVGDLVKVHTKIVEGEKVRIQIYQGTVIARKGRGTSESFTVSRVSFGYPNEKVFLLHSPYITEIEVMGRGIVRRSKLNYIRGKQGKAAKVRLELGKQVTAEEQVFFEEEVEAAPKVEVAEAKPQETTEG